MSTTRTYKLAMAALLSWAAFVACSNETRNKGGARPTKAAPKPTATSTDASTGSPDGGASQDHAKSGDGSASSGSGSGGSGANSSDPGDDNGGISTQDGHDDDKGPAPTCDIGSKQQVEEHRNLPYVSDGDSARQVLDVFVPAGCRSFPVVFFIHGGGWVAGSKDDAQIYAKTGAYFASRGIGMVMPNYRLAPSVKNRDQIKDATAALAWTLENVSKYGGRRDRVILSGHSAGGQISALIGTDEQWLKGVGLGFDDIRAVMPVSGVYDASALPGGSIFTSFIFGDASEVESLSAINHLNAGLRPFFVLRAESEMFGIDAQTEAFTAALRKAGAKLTTYLAKDRSHITIVGQAVDDADPTAKQIIEFVKSQM